jgi:hypothetical protein
VKPLLIGHGGWVNSVVQGTRAKRWVGILGMGLVLLILGACASTSASPLQRLTVEPTANADAKELANRLVLMLSAVEGHFVAGTAEDYLTPDAKPVDAPGQLAESFSLYGTSKAFFRAQSEHLATMWSTLECPTSVRVRATEVTQARDNAHAFVVLVTIATTYGFPQAPDTVTTARYAVTGDRAGDLVPDEAQGSSSPYRDDLILRSVMPFYDKDGLPALDSERGDLSPSHVVREYLDALRAGDDNELDELEGTIRSSADLRASLAGRVNAERYTLVELPSVQAGNFHVFYLVQEKNSHVVRFEVTTSASGPVVAAYLHPTAATE